MALQGPGFFVVRPGPAGGDGPVRLTRDGSLFVATDGLLVDHNGHAVLGDDGRPINLAGVPQRELTVDAAGVIHHRGLPVAAVAVRNPVDPAALRPTGGNLYDPAGADFADLLPGAAAVRNSALEVSNVSPGDRADPPARRPAAARGQREVPPVPGRRHRQARQRRRPHRLTPHLRKHLMAIIALHNAATGLKALSTRIDVTANNLANAETTAFKSSRVNFEDLMYLTQQHAGTRNALGDIDPAGVQVGLGVQIANTALRFEQGPLEPTDRPLDVAIQGEGFFRVRILDTIGDGVAYTRNGAFHLNPDGELVLDIGEGYRLDPGISIPEGAVDLSISQDGEISGRLPGDINAQVFGNLELVRFVNPHGLQQLGGQLFLETEASGQPFEARPGVDGNGVILQSFLEGSNVDPVKELVSLIKTQRAFELNSQSIQTADQALQTIGNLRRF